MRSAAWPMALTLAAALGSATASADPCAVSRLDPGAPLRIGMGPGGLGRLPEACARTELGIDTRGAVLIAMEDFYGSLEGGARLQGRIAWSKPLWVSFSTPGLDFRYNANATIDRFATDAGAGLLGLHYGMAASPTMTVAPFVRVMTPTESVYRNATRYGVDHGVSVVTRLTQRNELAGGFVFPLYLVAGPGSTHASFQPLVAVDWIYSPLHWLGLVGGAGVRLRGGDDAAFESLDPRLGLRFHPWRGLRIDVAAAAPLFGADRTDFVAGLGLAWTMHR